VGASSFPNNVVLVPDLAPTPCFAALCDVLGLSREKFALLASYVPASPFKRALEDWNALRLRKGAAWAFTKDVLGLRRLDDVCEQDLEHFRQEYFKK